nr:MAG TPA: hypothetical protein [Caudoviricetes sp.]
MCVHALNFSSLLCKSFYISALDFPYTLLYNNGERKASPYVIYTKNKTERRRRSHAQFLQDLQPSG